MIRLRRFVLAALCAVQCAAYAQTPYVLKDTETVALPAAPSGRQYDAFVSLPPGYGQSAQRYPVVYLVDADYGFPLVRAIAHRLRGSRLTEDFILVGLSYARGETSTASRNRDYTLGREPAQADPTAQAGMAGPYLEYLGKAAFPALEARYRIDPARRVFVGHSYGALLGLQALFTQPRLFSHYILGSPSLWYDKRLAFDVEQRYAAQHRVLPARVHLYAGSYEAFDPVRPRYSRTGDMVADVARFAERMRGRGYEGLDLDSTVLDGEDHATVFPSLATRGLIWALPTR